MTELTDITQQAEVEFVNREFAEAEALRAITLLRVCDESKIEAWFALQAVADQVGPLSNVGVRGISWDPSGPVPRYGFWIACTDGIVHTSTGAPRTLVEARRPEHLDKAREMLAGLVAAKGGGKKGKRPVGTGAALVEAVSASPEGRAWVERSKKAEFILRSMVNVADSYGREGCCPWAGLGAHLRFITFDNRAELVREFPSYTQANAKVMALRGKTTTAERSLPRPTRGTITKLAIRTGVSRAEASAILRAVMDGRSKTKLIRAVNEAIKMVEADPRAQRLKVAA